MKKGGLKYILIAVILVGIFVPSDFVFAGSIIDSVFKNLAEVFSFMFKYVFWTIMKIASLLMGLSGVLLNKVIELSIFNMSSAVRNMEGINIAWDVIKDLMNIGFIFMLIYQAIRVILSIDDVSQVRKFVIGIFLAAILINFSLFFTKIIIDASNIVTVGIYNNIVPPAVGNNILNSGLSNAYQQSLGMQSFFSGGVIENSQSETGEMFGYIAMTVLFVIVTFIFLAISVMFIVRYIVLLALLTLSPIAYMGLAWKGMQKHANKWWESLWGQVLWPPVYMIMTWVILKIIGSPGFFGPGTSGVQIDYATISNINTGDLAAQVATTLISFALVIGLTIASLIISKQFATQGASEIGKFTAGATAFAGGALLGGTARLGRSTFGRVGNRWANDEELKKQAVEGNFRQRLTAKTRLAVGNRAAESTFDARATRVGKTAIGQVLGQEGAFGKVDTKKDTFKALRDERMKEAEKRAERYKPSDLAVQKAKETLGSQEFRIEEAKRKAERETFRNSDAYWNSEEGKKEKELQNEGNANKAEMDTNEKQLNLGKERVKQQDSDIKYLRDRIGRFNELYNKPVRTQAEETQLNRLKEVVLKDQEKLGELKREKDAELKQITERGQKNAELKVKYDDTLQQLNKIQQEEEVWLSDEAKQLVAISGGQKEAKENGKITRQAVEGAYQQRVGKEAENVEKRNALWRYTANTVGTITNIAGLTSQPMTRNDRQELARKMKKKAGGKTAEQEAKDALKRLNEEARKRGEKVGDEDEDETTSAKSTESATPPAPPPPPPPTGGTTT